MSTRATGGRSLATLPPGRALVLALPLGLAMAGPAFVLATAGTAGQPPAGYPAAVQLTATQSSAVQSFAVQSFAVQSFVGQSPAVRASAGSGSFLCGQPAARERAGSPTRSASRPARAAMCGWLIAAATGSWSSARPGS